MPNPPASTSELVWLLAVVLPPLVAAGVSITVALITRRDTKADLARAQAGVDTITEQVQNTHTQNLREDLDEKFEAVGERLDTVAEHVRDLRVDVGGLHAETRDLRLDVTGIRTDARRSRRELAEHITACTAPTA